MSLSADTWWHDNGTHWKFQSNNIYSHRWLCRLPATGLSLVITLSWQTFPRGGGFGCWTLKNLKKSECNSFCQENSTWSGLYLPHEHNTYFSKSFWTTLSAWWFHSDDLYFALQVDLALPTTVVEIVVLMLLYNRKFMQTVTTWLKKIVTNVA